MLAALSNASPAASSSVAPRGSWTIGRAAVEEAGVSAGGDEGDAGEDRRLAFQRGRISVRVEVVDADERQVPEPGEGLRGSHADEQRADESGSVDDGDGIEVLDADGGLFERAPGGPGRMVSRCARQAISGTTPP